MGIEFKFKQHQYQQQTYVLAFFQTCPHYAMGTHKSYFLLELQCLIKIFQSAFKITHMVVMKNRQLWKFSSYEQFHDAIL